MQRMGREKESKSVFSYWTDGYLLQIVLGTFQGIDNHFPVDHCALISLAYNFSGYTLHPLVYSNSQLFQLFMYIIFTPRNMKTHSTWTTKPYLLNQRVQSLPALWQIDLVVATTPDIYSLSYTPKQLSVQIWKFGATMNHARLYILSLLYFVAVL